MFDLFGDVRGCNILVLDKPFLYASVLRIGMIHEKHIQKRFILPAL
jgi:hypothetical protein